MTAIDQGVDLDAMLARTPPHNAPAEMIVLGSAMESTGSFDEAIGAGITGQDFYLPAHELVWDTIVRLATSGAPFGPTSVFGAMQREGTVRLLPNAAYLYDLTQYAKEGAVAYHATAVREHAAKRRAISVGTQILQAGWDPTVTALDVTAIADGAAATISPPLDDSQWSTAADVMELVRERFEETRTVGQTEGIRWGYADVDRRMTPIQPGELALVVAWSGGGKSVVASNLALDTALTTGRTCLVHTMEMTRLDLGQRFAAKTAGVRLERIIAAVDLSYDEVNHFEWALEQVAAAPLIIDQSPQVSLSMLRTSIRKHRPELVIVDQIPIMAVDDPRISREQQLTKLTYSLKTLAAVEGVVIVACAQLNSAPMGRADKLPTLQDIRESRGIGNAVDIAVFLHDPTGGKEEHERTGEIDWIVRKQRKGQADFVVPLAKQYHFSRLADLP